MKMQNRLVILSAAVLTCFSAFAEHTPVKFSSTVSAGGSGTISFSNPTVQPNGEGVQGFGKCSANSSILSCTAYSDVVGASVSASAYLAVSPTEQQLTGTVTYQTNQDGTLSVSFASANPGLSCELSPSSGNQLNKMPMGAANISLACLTVPTPAPTAPPQFITQIAPGSSSGMVFSGTPVWTTGFTGCEANELATAITCSQVNMSMVGSSFSVAAASGVLTYTIASDGTVNASFAPGSGAPECDFRQIKVAPTASTIETDVLLNCAPSSSSPQTSNSKNWIKTAWRKIF